MQVRTRVAIGDIKIGSLKPVSELGLDNSEIEQALNAGHIVEVDHNDTAIPVTQSLDALKALDKQKEAAAAAAPLYPNARSKQTDLQKAEAAKAAAANPNPNATAMPQGNTQTALPAQHASIGSSQTTTSSSGTSAAAAAAQSSK